MATLFMEQTLSPHNQIKNPKRKTHPHYLHHQPNISRQASSVSNQNFAPFVHDYDMKMNMIMHGGVPFNNNHPHNINTTPFHMSTSLPPYFQHLKYNNNINSKHFQQPPLLPLPAASYSSFRSLSGLGRSQSLTPQAPRKHTHKKISPQKPKKENKNSSNTTNNSNDDKKGNKTTKAEGAKALAKDTDNENENQEIVGPDPASLPKDVTRMLMGDVECVVTKMEKFSGSIFSMAPPPSSLPLPKFSLRQPKLSCTAEAAVAAAAIEVDSGATDSLRRMLKLR